MRSSEWTVAGILIATFTAASQTAAPISIVEHEADATRPAGLTITNQGTSALTAVTFAREGSGAGANQFPTYDSATKQWRELAPGASSSIGFSPNASVTNRKPVASIFADGTTFGSDEALQTLLSRRRHTLAGLTIALQHLPDPPPEDSSRQQLVKLFQASSTEQSNATADEDTRIAITNIHLIIQRTINATTPPLRPSAASSTC